MITAVAAAAALLVLPSRSQNKSIQDSRPALNALFHQYWEESLAFDPEFASTIGDKRFNDKVRDYSVRALNAHLAREQEMLLKAAAIDPAGLTADEKTSRDLFLREIEEEEEGEEFKSWEMPI